MEPYEQHQQQAMNVYYCHTVELYRQLSDNGQNTMPDKYNISRGLHDNKNIQATDKHIIVEALKGLKGETMCIQEVFNISNVLMECNGNKNGLLERWSLFLVYITVYCFSLHVPASRCLSWSHIEVCFGTFAAD